MTEVNELQWLLFLYSIPANPVNNRVKIWRKLQKAGAVQLKGGVYILPAREEFHEALQWLLAELPGLQGEGLLVKTDTIEPLGQADIIALFHQQCQHQYQEVATKIDEFFGRITNLRKGGRDKKSSSLFKQFAKMQADFQEIQQRDFFQSPMGKDLALQIAALRKKLAELLAVEQGEMGSLPATWTNGRRFTSYSGLTWITRPRPFVDRMACAWLIRRFIDDKAAFAFRDEHQLREPLAELEVVYDVRNGDFTHIEEFCTFEVLIKSFDLVDQGLEVLAKIVHDIDIKDGKFATAEASGIEMIIKGIRNKNLPDIEALEQGMAIFESLYLATKEKQEYGNKQTKQ